MKKEKNKIKKKNPFQKREIFQVFLVCLILFIVLVYPNVANAGESWFWSLSDIAANVGLKLLNSILYGLFVVATYLLAMAQWLMDTVTKPDIYDKVFFSGAALVGLNTVWSFVRDFLNMFFILLILLIAIGTILRVDKFNYKTHLFQIILAAILINFSKAITLVVIDVSQLAMNFFLKGINGTAFKFTSTILDKTGLDEIWKTESSSDSASLTAALGIGLCFILILTFVLFLLAIALVVRMVAFYTLIILSPLAMFGIALKGLSASNMTSDWIKKLISWAFFGPVMAFFLWVALVLIDKIAKVTSANPVFTQDFGSAGGLNGQEKSFVATYLGLLIPYLTAVYLLYYGFDLSRKMSIGAAAGILNWGEGKMKSLGKTALKYAGSAALGVGTLGIAPAAMWGAKKLGNYVKDYSGAKLKGFMDKDREKASRLNPMRYVKSKTTRDEERKKRREKWEAKAKGKDAYNKYMRGEVSGGLKDIKDKGGINKDIADKMLKSKDEKERKMGAKWLAEEGKVNDKDMATSVMEATGGDAVLASQIRESGVKKNESAFIDYDIDNALTGAKKGGEDWENEIQTNKTLNNLLKGKTEEEKKAYLEALFNEDGTIDEEEFKKKLTSEAYKDLIDRKGVGILDQNPEAFNDHLAAAVNEKMESNRQFAKEFYKGIAKKGIKQQENFRKKITTVDVMANKEKQKEEDEEAERAVKRKKRNEERIAKLDKEDPFSANTGSTITSEEAIKFAEDLKREAAEKKARENKKNSEDLTKKESPIIMTAGKYESINDLRRKAKN